VIATLSKRLFEKLRRKPYRDAYVAEHVRTGIAYQVRNLRDQRGWAQKKLAETMEKPQSVVSRLEDPDYGKLSVQSLLEVASAFDVALLIQYISYPEFLRCTRDVSPQALEAESFDEKQFMIVENSQNLGVMARRIEPTINIFDQPATTNVVVGRILSRTFSFPVSTKFGQFFPAAGSQTEMRH
jgi:transcriptional regulator with XRE-family HTH domain